MARSQLRRRGHPLPAGSQPAGRFSPQTLPSGAAAARPRPLTCCRSESRVSPRAAASPQKALILHTRLSHPVTVAQGGPCAAPGSSSALALGSLGEWHVLASQGSGATEPPGPSPNGGDGDEGLSPPPQCQTVCDSGSAQQASLCPRPCSGVHGATRSPVHGGGWSPVRRHQA